MIEYLSQKIKAVSFFAIIMVIILHCYNLDMYQKINALEVEKNTNWFIQTIISYGATRIAVPLFFIISGYLFFFTFNGNSDFILKIKKRFNTLVIPYLFWSFFGILFYYVLQSIPQTQEFFSKKPIREYSTGELLDVAFINIIPYQLWFIRDLIILTLVSPAIYFLIKKLNFWFLLFILPFWFLNQDSIFFASESILFFSLGVFLTLHYQKSLELILPKKYMIIATILWMMFLLLKIVAEKYGYIPSIGIQILHKISILFGIISFWSLYDLLFKANPSGIQKYKPLFAFTFFIYAFHEPILTIIKKGLFYILGKQENKLILVYVLSPFLTIVICLIVGYCLKKLLPNVFKLITGNR